jgi:hypothetical protein
MIPELTYIFITKFVFSFYHHHLINVPTAGAQAFLMDNPQGERGVQMQWKPTASRVCLPKHEVARDNKFLVTHSMTDL